MKSDNLIDALYKTYAEIPAIMLQEDLIILISNDWIADTELKDIKYRGIEVQQINLINETEQIYIMTKSNYNFIFDHMINSMKDFKFDCIKDFKDEN
jgi:hypothetical protein